MPDLGDRLREALDRLENKKAKKNVPYLADKAGVSKQNLYNILNGTNKDPGDEILKVIAEELNLDFIYLKYGDEVKKVYYTEPILYEKLIAFDENFADRLKEIIATEETPPYIAFKPISKRDLENMLENMSDEEVKYLLTPLYTHALKKDSTK
jgi:transcriptional regulator with XRE-family HTH domain